MKIVLCLSLVLLCNWISIHKISAKPIDEWEQNSFTTAGDTTVLDAFTDLTAYDYSFFDTLAISRDVISSTAGENTSYHTATTIEATTAESTASDAYLTSITDIEITTVSSIDVTTGNDTLGENATQASTMDEATTSLTSRQAGPSDRVNLQVLVSPATLQVQRGQTYELLCHVYGADASTNIYWIQEEPERRYALTDTVDKHVTMAQVSLRVRLTIDDPSKIGKYTCMAQDANGNSGSGILTMQEDDYYYHRTSTVMPHEHYSLQYLSIVTPDMADGDYVEIQCEGAAPEDEGTIQWYFNNRLLHDEQPFYLRGKTLHIRPISPPYLGNYRCSIPSHRYGDASTVITFREQPSRHVDPVFSPSSPLTIDEGASQFIQSPVGYYRAYWTRNDGQGLPSGIHQSGNDLQITSAHADHSGTYNCELYNADGNRITVPYEIHVRRSHTHHSSSHVLPKISIRPQTINLKEGQRMIIQYTIVSNEPIDVIWTKYTDQGYVPLSASFTVEPNRLILQSATPADAGVYQITVRNSHGETREELRVNVEWLDHEHVRESHQQKPVRVTVHPTEVTVEPGGKAKLTCYVQGTQQYQVTWGKYASDTRLPDFARQQGNSVIITPPADAPVEHIYLQCQVDVPGQTQAHLAYAPVSIHGGKRKRRDARRKLLVTHMRN